jgi:Ca2+-transporting ATPase
MEHLWYSQKTDEIFIALGSRNAGLTDAEVGVHLAKYGKNKLPEGKVDNLLLIFFRQFQNPLVYILFAASLIVFAMHEYIDGLIILFVLFFNAIVGTIQEGKAQNTLLALKKFTTTNTTVLRNGKEIIIPDYEAVPGDIILLQEGDKVPADARIFISDNLMVDESALTGESIPVRKITEALEGTKLPTTGQTNMVFKGTHVVGGDGQAIIVATGLHTVLGKISKEIAIINTEIPLKANIRDLSRLIILAVGIICTSLFFLGLLKGESVRVMFTTVVSLSVSIIPEGLPIVMTLVLATGVWRMSKRNVLVKKLQAVEALGQARVIAVDKTGTLTKNEISLQKVYVNEKTFDVGGSGYDPVGDISFQGKKVTKDDFPELSLSGKIAALGANNNVALDEQTQKWKPSGDPTEAGLAVFALKAGFHKDLLEKESPKLSEIPFDYINKFHAIAHKVDGKTFLTVIGAPEVILKLCTDYLNNSIPSKLSDEKMVEIEKTLVTLSEEGLRVLAFATREDSPEVIKTDDIKELTFGGFFGFKDTLRPEVHEAMREATEAGIKVVMITGDHKITAKAIAREAGIYHDGDTVLTGEEIDSLSLARLADTLSGVSVFARVTPEHKLKIIQAYELRGEIIAMTGDGVNDAPSLVAADLGVSMGKIGTEVAKEASDIVLLDDNFGSIIAAIEEGRSIYKTIKKVIVYLFSTSLGEVFTITAALLLGFPLPILAAQIVWLNLVTDGFLDVSLSMEPMEDGLLKGTFEHPKKYLIDGLAIKRMFLMAVPMMIGTLYMFRNYVGADMTKAWTISLTTLAVFQWFNAWNCRHESKSILQLNPLKNLYLTGATIIVIILQLVAIYMPFMQKILHTAPLKVTEWILIVLVASSIIWVEETRKFIYRNTRSPE